MRLAFVCSGKPDNLKYLTNNRTMVDELLTQHGWKVIQTPLYSIADLNRRLQEYQNSNIDEFLFFYTGHGDVSNRQQILKLQLDNTEISLNDVLDSIFKYINPKKQAIVLDACYSGTLKDLTLENNTEFLFSSQAREQSYEDDALEASVFSFYFCEAVENGYVKLEEISNYIASCDDRQKPLPMRVGSELISILQEIKNNKLLRDDKKLQSNAFYLSNKTDVKQNTLFKNRYFILFFSLMLIGFLIFNNFGESNPTINIDNVKMNNKGESLYIKIESLLTLSKNLLNEYLKESSNQTKATTLKELYIQIEQQKDVILVRSEKYIEIKNSYQYLIDNYYHFLKFCQEKSFVFSRIQKINVNLRNLRVSIERLKGIYESEMLYLNVLKKQQRNTEQLLKHSINQSIVSYKTEKAISNIGGQLK